MDRLQALQIEYEIPRSARRCACWLRVVRWPVGGARPPAGIAAVVGIVACAVRLALGGRPGDGDWPLLAVCFFLVMAADALVYSSRFSRSPQAVAAIYSPAAEVLVPIPISPGAPCPARSRDGVLRARGRAWRILVTVLLTRCGHRREYRRGVAAHVAGDYAGALRIFASWRGADMRRPNSCSAPCITRARASTGTRTKRSLTTSWPPYRGIRMGLDSTCCRRSPSSADPGIWPKFSTMYSKRRARPARRSGFGPAVQGHEADLQLK